MTALYIIGIVIASIASLFSLVTVTIAMLNDNVAEFLGSFLAFAGNVLILTLLFAVII